MVHNLTLRGDGHLIVEQGERVPIFFVSDSIAEGLVAVPTKQDHLGQSVVFFLPTLQGPVGVVLFIPLLGHTDSVCDGVVCFVVLSHRR